MNQIFRIILILLVISLPLFYGCENNLSDEGLSYISSDTLGTLLLDSQLDTMNITSNNFIKYINTSSSANMLVGLSSNYESKTLLRFTSLPTNYDTTTVVSAKLNIRYNKTFYQDSLGLTSFNIYRVNTYYDFSTLTYDKFYNEIGTNALGNYTGTPTDTSLISLSLDNQTVGDWLKYAHDTNYANKNYGVILLPNSNTTTIKAFCSSKYSNSSFIPYVTVVVLEPTGGKQDTLNFYSSEFTSLNYVPQINTIPGRFIVQNGVSIKDILKFDLSKLPEKVIINQALLELKVDWQNSFFTTGIDTRLIGNMLTSDTLTSDGINYYSIRTDTNTYSLYLTIAFQKWNYGISTNLGFMFKNIYDYSNLDRYVFYGPDYSDISKRPRLKIRYSIRR